MFCQFCGTAMDASVKFCASCGRSQEPDPQPPPPPPPDIPQPPPPQPSNVVVPLPYVQRPSGAQTGKWISDGWQLMSGQVLMIVLATVLAAVVANITFGILSGAMAIGTFILLTRKMVRNTVDIGHELGAKFAVYWPGSLGYYVQGAIDEVETLRWYAEALNAACDRDIEVAKRKGVSTMKQLK